MFNGWFIIIAQAVNFLILVWLLKRFLYKPILHAIDEREKGIATQLAKAEAKVAEAQKERDDFQHKNDVFDQERAALLKKASDDANAERQRLLEEARTAADALRANRQEALRNEQLQLNQEIIRWTQKQVFAITRKTLSDLAGASLEERMGDVFVQRVRALAGQDKDQLTTAFNTSNHTASVHSAFEVPPAQRSAIESAVKETFAPDARVQFETAPELVSGIELSVGGHKVAWSIADYLATLEKNAAELVRMEAKPDPKGEAKPEAKAEAKPVAKAEAKPKPVAKPEAEPKAKDKPEAKAEAEPKPEAKPELEPVSSASKGTP